MCSFSVGWRAADQSVLLRATDGALLGLRSWLQAPDQWQARLMSYSLPGNHPAAVPMVPRQHWDQNQLLLVSEDISRPLQVSYLAPLSPVQGSTCKS